MNRRDRAAYAKALASMKRWGREGQLEGWTAGEWNDLIARAAAQKPDRLDFDRIPILRPLVSAAAVLIVLAGATLFLLKAPPVDLSARNAARPAEIAAPPTRTEGMRTLPETVSPDSARPALSSAPRLSAYPETRNLLASAARPARPQEDKPAFTWISPDTGLQIVWFTNNNLNLEDRQ